MGKHRVKIVCLIAAMVIMLCIGAVSIAAPQTEKASATHVVKQFDYEKGSIAISIGSLLALIGLSLKLGGEIQRAKSHMSDLSIHLNEDYKKDLESRMAQMRNKTECDRLHEMWAQIQSEHKEQLHALQADMKKNWDLLSRIDERTSALIGLHREKTE